MIESEEANHYVVIPEARTLSRRSAREGRWHVTGREAERGGGGKWGGTNAFSAKL